MELGGVARAAECGEQVRRVEVREEVAAVDDLVIRNEVDTIARPLVKPAPGHAGSQAGRVGLQRLVRRLAGRLA